MAVLEQRPTPLLLQMLFRSEQAEAQWQEGAPNPFLDSSRQTGWLSRGSSSQLSSNRASPCLSHPHHTGSSHTGRTD